MRTKQNKPTKVASGSGGSTKGPTKPFRTDGWQNFRSGLGTSRDPATQGSYYYQALTYPQLQALWRGYAIIARIIERPVEDMLRQGYKIHTGDKILDADILALYDHLNVNEHLARAMQFERAYGGGAVFLGTDDASVDEGYQHWSSGSALLVPLDLDRVTKLNWVQSFDASELQTSDWCTDPTSSHYLRPNSYTARIVTGGMLPIHRSRMLQFSGIFVSNVQHRQKMGWGDSVIARIWNEASAFEQSWNAVTHIFGRFSQPVIKIEGYAELVAANDTEAFNAKIRSIDEARSILNSTVLDAMDEYTQVTTPLTGLGEVVDRMAIRLAAAADMPVTLLFGQSPAGMNATGESDIRGYYDRIKAMQGAKLKPRLEYLTEIAIRTLNNGQPRDFTIEFNPLWQATSVEQADLRLKQAQTDQIYLQEGVITEDEVAHSRFGEEEFNHKTQLDTENRKPINIAPTTTVQKRKFDEPEAQDPNSILAGYDVPGNGATFGVGGMATVKQ